MTDWNRETIRTSLRQWLEEDIGTGDVTTMGTIPLDHRSKGIIHVKDNGVVAGLDVAGEVFALIDPALKYTKLSEDGPTRIADTRKTTPGHRLLEKYAVRVGGGYNHRFGLYDAVMIKDNHIKAAGGITAAVSAARQAIPHTMKIEVEVESFEQLQEALQARADIIMLDNMSVDRMTEAVRIIRNSAPHILIEASGNVTLETVKAIAETGVDVISAGRLTYSVQALDISLDLNERKEAGA
ncbi:MAG: nicotinate-nucleotide pyrophosphorylase [Paenibacillaceae bacterium]|nr:nicotinate-nucleotide pyrophosphorylase [Paenibacillaceae bacterium]